jgi:hypothetical protein
MTPFPFSRLAVPTLVCVGLSCSCASILGIEDARCDPDFDVACNAADGFGTSEGGAAGESGAAGTSASNDAGSEAAGTAGSSDEPVAPNPGDTLCGRYCASLSLNCIEGNQQYASEMACLAVCAVLEPGAPGDASGNTVECRLGRAELAGSTGEPSNYCFSAGPGGAGVCGSNCEGFCRIMTATCSELGTNAECLETCSLVPDRSLPPESEPYNTASQAGNSLQCRLFHVSAASLDPPGHCAHAAGATPCNDPL